MKKSVEMVMNDKIQFLFLFIFLGCSVMSVTGVSIFIIIRLKIKYELMRSQALVHDYVWKEGVENPYLNFPICIAQWSMLDI